MIQRQLKDAERSVVGQLFLLAYQCDEFAHSALAFHSKSFERVVREFDSQGDRFHAFDGIDLELDGRVPTVTIGQCL